MRAWPQSHQKYHLVECRRARASVATDPTPWSTISPQYEYCCHASSSASRSLGGGSDTMYSTTSDVMVAISAPYFSRQYRATAVCSQGEGHAFQSPKRRCNGIVVVSSVGIMATKTSLTGLPA